MLEQIPGYSLVEIPMYYQDMPDPANTNPVKNVFFLCPAAVSEQEKIAELAHVKEEQFRHISARRWYENERRREQGKQEYWILKRAALDWFSVFGLDFRAKHKLSGLEGGIILYDKVKGIFISNNPLIIGDRAVDVREGLRLLLGE